jgi:lipopolysaccharide transport system permease protein
MTAPAIAAPAGPHPTIVIERRRSVALDLRAFWEQRELLYFLTWRDVKLRYRQTAIGAAWVLVQPLLTLAVLSVVFGRFAAMQTGDVPYVLFALTGLLPWMFVSQTVAIGAGSLVADQSLLTRVYFPRLYLPLARIARGAFDLGVALLLLVPVMAWSGVAPTARLVLLPLALLFAAAAALAVTLWLAPLNVRYRDIANTIPFLLQVWMFASPVIYPVHLVPEHLRLVYGLNPVAGVIEAFRGALLPGPTDARLVTQGVVVVAVLLVAGLLFFRRAERTLADVV